MTRVQELCRKLRPVLGKKVDRLWKVYLAESDAGGRADIEQTLEMLASKHLGQNYEPDRAPFPPPERETAANGDIELGQVAYGLNRQSLYPFSLQSHRLKEHLLIAGRSGSGKTNLTFVLLSAIMARGAPNAGHGGASKPIHVLAIDWKRGYRDLLALHPDLRVYTVGRDVAPIRFNPLIPPPGCEPHVWIKLIVDVIASAYLGGEGVISLLVAGIDKLYRDAGVYDHRADIHWPTITDLLTWLKSAKLKGRAAMWQASAERILLAMTYGEFGAVVDTQDNQHICGLLDHHVVLEMDGLSSNADRKMFSEALTLYLYRYRLAQGPQRDLTNLIVLEEAHNLLLQKAADARESVLESSIRMVRQYGIGYVFVDQSASLLSKVAFANSYATIALSQKLRSDVQAISGAMNLTDEQKQALSTLPIGSAVMRLADSHPEPFLIQVPRSPVKEGEIDDLTLQQHMGTYPTDSAITQSLAAEPEVITPIPAADKNKELQKENRSHPPPPEDVPVRTDHPSGHAHPPTEEATDLGTEGLGADLSREAVRFLADIAQRPLSTTVARYQRLHMSRRKGNAIRQQLDKAGVIESVSIATRSGQTVLYQLTDMGRQVCASAGIEMGSDDQDPRQSLQHRFWVAKARTHFEAKGYDVTTEHHVPDDGFIDLLAVRPNEQVAIEVETGKSNIRANLAKLKTAGFDRIILIATDATAVNACQRVLRDQSEHNAGTVELRTWLDVS